VNVECFRNADEDQPGSGIGRSAAQISPASDRSQQLYLSLYLSM
jgi:hypothetical protein